MVRIADIGVVQDQILSSHAIKSRLHESTHLGGDATGVKNGGLIHGCIIVGTKVLRGSVTLASLGMGERSLHHGAERNKLCLLVGSHGVTSQFKVSADRCKAWSKGLDVAGSARHAGLTCKAGHGAEFCALQESVSY